MATNNSGIQIQDRSQNALIDQKEAKPQQIILYGEQKLVPYYLGGHQGYYSDLTPVPSYDPIEFVLEIITIAILVITWVFYQIQYLDFDSEIPIVFDMRGNVVRTGQKLILYILPGLDTFIFVIFTILQFITNRFRYQVQVTPENAKDIFKLTRKLIIMVKLITLLLFVFLTFGTISIINNDMDGYLLSYSVLAVLIYGALYYWYMLRLQAIVDRTL